METTNRYMSPERVEELFNDAVNRVMYHAPDETQQREHGKINNVILSAMSELIEICPDSRELAIALTHLWEARNAAHGAIALAKPLEDDDNTHKSKWD